MTIGFRERLMLGTTLLLVAFVAAAVAVLTWLTGHYASEQVARGVDESRGSFQAQMQQRRSALQDQTRILARTPILRATAAIDSVDQATCDGAFDEIQTDFATPVVALVGSDGRLLASRGAELAAQQDLRGMPGVTAALAGTGGDHVWPMDTKLLLVAMAPIVQGDQLLGVLVRGQPIDAAFAAGISALAGRDVLLVHDGTLLALSWRRDPPAEWDPEPLLGLLHDVVPAAGIPLELPVDGRMRAGLVVHLHPDGGLAFLAHDLGSILDVREQARRWLLILGAILMLLGIAFATRTAARLAAPLRALIGAVDRIGGGDLGARVSLTMKDEIGRLGQSFNAMAQTMQTLVADVTDKAARAEAANRAKDGFLTSMSHELRTPLCGIQSTAELLQQFGEDASREERAEFLSTILREAERLGRRITDALEFAALSGGKAKWTLGRVELLRACTLAARRLDSLRALKEVDFAITSADDAALQGDREHITQAICHLLQNAWTWSPAGGTVEVTVCAVAQGFVVEVADRGPGIPADERGRIFDYFTQGGSVLVDKPQGIGIGLKIASEVAQAHGGCVEYGDRAGGGAVFRLLLRCEDRPVDRLAVPEAVDESAPATAG